MTPEQHDAFTNTNITNLGVLIFNLLTRNIVAIDIACLVISISLVIFSHAQCRKAERRWQQVVKKHMDAGGMVMLVKRGRHMQAVPMPIYRDLS